MIEEFFLSLVCLFGLLVARAQYLYGRSAFEASEYGGRFLPSEPLGFNFETLSLNRPRTLATYPTVVENREYW